MAISHNLLQLVQPFSFVLPALGRRHAVNLRYVRSGIRLDPATAARAFGDAYFNLLRRSADGSLTLSSDHWRLDEATSELFRFQARDAEAPPLEVRLDQVEELVWDRLPKQQVRSQIRFVLANGDLWTFSGSVDVSVLPGQ